MKSIKLLLKTLGVFLFLIESYSFGKDSLSFDFKQKNVRAQTSDHQVVIEYPFQNKSSKSITIQSFQASCSCIKIEEINQKKSFASGERGTVRAIFDIGTFTGTIKKQVMVFLEGDQANQPSIILDASIEIPVLVDIEPRTLRWEKEGSRTSQVFNIRMKEALNIKITKIECANSLFKHELKVIKDGAEYQLVVTPQHTNSISIGAIKIHTNAKEIKSQVISIYAVIQNATKHAK